MSRRTARVTTVVAAIFIGAALTGPGVASAGLDNESDTSSPSGDSTGSTDTRTPSLGSLGIPGISTEASPGGAGGSDTPTSGGPSGDNLPESRFGNGRSPRYNPPTGEGTSEGPQTGTGRVPPHPRPHPNRVRILPVCAARRWREWQEDPETGTTPPSDLDEPTPGPNPPPAAGTPGDARAGVAPGPADPGARRCRGASFGTVRSCRGVAGGQSTKPQPSNSPAPSVPAPLR